MPPLKTICVYCGSQHGKNPNFSAAAQVLGKSMAENGVGLVYGGGTIGIMGHVARSVAEHGGKVLGIIPQFLIDYESDANNLQDFGEVIITEDMHERKHKMFEHSDAFVALPGGIGTLEEIVEIMTWAQLGRHRKPMVFANVDGFWNPMLKLIDHMQEEEFLHASNRARPLVVEDPEKIVMRVIEQAAENDNHTEGVREVIEKM